MNASFRKYTSYALGELLLVVVGILIALQIDNWNDDRKERAMLRSYLESIARNMREDLDELQMLHARRYEAREAADQLGLMRRKSRFSVAEIAFLRSFRELNTTEIFFNANSSGFEALKMSGVLGRLQGSRLQRLMSDYYDMVSQITRLEDGFHEKLRALSLRLDLERPSNLEAWEIAMPYSIPPEMFEELQPAYNQLINSPVLEALANAQFENSDLLLYYESLRVVGQAFIDAVEQQRPDASIELPRTPLQDWRESLGLAEIIGDGETAFHAYNVLATSDVDQQGKNPFRFDSLQRRGDYLRIDYPGGANWAAILWTPSNAKAGRSYLDFSRFSQLQLEMKGDLGGEKLSIHVKDADYPDHASPISVEITLTDDWQTYSLDLAEFEPNDLSRLNVALGFLIFPAEQPMAFSVRHARYQ